MTHLTSCLPDGRLLLYVWFEAMHTRIDMMFCTDLPENLVLDMARDIEEGTYRIERWGSCFLAGSEVSLINTAPIGEFTQVSDELCRLLSDCVIYSEKTGGIFDIMVSEKKPGIPLKEKLTVDIHKGAVCRLKDGFTIDLSGLLKGYALDQAMKNVKERGITDALLSFGNSSISACGNHPNGKGWPVAYEDDESGTFVLYDECLTTSGNNTAKRVHIIDPRTGEAVTGKRKVSVRTSSGEEGEVLATVKFITTNS